MNKAEKISLQNYDIIIWGAGNTTELNRYTIEEEGLTPVYFVDNDRSKWGGLKWGIKIISPDEIRKSCVNPVILISSANARTCQEIVSQLQGLKINNYYMIDEIIWGRHKSEILAVYDMLNSDYSKKLFTTIIASRIVGDEVPEECVKGEQYFGVREFRIRNSREIFVDCGAYVGDTIEKFLNVKEGVFKEIYAFEPEPGNFNAILNRVERLQREWGLSKKIHVIEGAVGRKCGNAFINSDRESMSAKMTGADSGEKVQVYTIDSYFKDKDIGFIKADIEGAEMDMLEGATECIKKNKPLLAICIYHQSADIYKIPLLLRKLNNNYKMDILHHYYNYNETILYAY